MVDESKQFRIQLIYGNPKHGGFVHGCLDRVAEHLEKKGARIERLHLVAANIHDCIGCFMCLRNGNCSIDDQMAQIIEDIRQADGLVVGASVRNGFFPALYKRFYERITYILGFGRELRAKHVLAIGAVGMAGGRKPLGKLLTFREFHTHVVDYLFFRAGIPTRLKVEDVADKLDHAADGLYDSIASRSPLSLRTKLLAKVDDFIIRKYLLEPNQGSVFDYTIAQWRRKGLM